MGMKVAGVLCLVFAAYCIAIGLFLSSASAWQTISLGLLGVGVALFVLGLFLVRKSRKN